MFSENYTKKKCIQMRDGAELFTLLTIHPKMFLKKYPIIMQRTPYNFILMEKVSSKKYSPSETMMKEGYIVVLSRCTWRL
jgi:predicted acyl esterase